MCANHRFALQIKTHLILIFCEVGAIIDSMLEKGNLCYEERLSNLPDIQLINGTGFLIQAKLGPEALFFSLVQCSRYVLQSSSPSGDFPSAFYLLSEVTFPHKFLRS